MNFKVLIIFSLAILLSAHVVSAAEVERFKLTGNEAQAFFNKFDGCADNTVGVTVIQNLIKRGSSGKTPTSELQIFGSLENVCNPNLDIHFYATTTLNQDEYSQDGLNGAYLEKSFQTSDGYNVALNIVWTGEGETQVYANKIKNDVDIYKMRGQSSVTQRSALPTGKFEINGLDYASSSTSIYGILTQIRSNVTTLTK